MSFSNVFCFYCSVSLFVRLWFNIWSVFFVWVIIYSHLFCPSFHASGRMFFVIVVVSRKPNLLERVLWLLKKMFDQFISDATTNEVRDA